MKHWTGKSRQTQLVVPITKARKKRKEKKEKNSEHMHTTCAFVNCREPVTLISGKKVAVLISHKLMKHKTYRTTSLSIGCRIESF